MTAYPQFRGEDKAVLLNCKEKQMEVQTTRFNEQREGTTIKIALCGTTALLMCFLGEFPNAAVAVAATLIGDMAVMTMFTLYFAMSAKELASVRPESRKKVDFAAESIDLALKIAFAALCSLTGSVIIHAVALIVSVILSKIYVLKSVNKK